MDRGTSVLEYIAKLEAQEKQQAVRVIELADQNQMLREDLQAVDTKAAEWRKVHREAQAENARLRKALQTLRNEVTGTLQADSLLSEVEVFFANGSPDDGMDLWSRISDFRTSTTSSRQESSYSPDGDSEGRREPRVGSAAGTSRQTPASPNAIGAELTHQSAQICGVCMRPAHEGLCPEFSKQSVQEAKLCRDCGESPVHKDGWCKECFHKTRVITAPEKSEPVCACDEACEIYVCSCTCHKGLLGEGTSNK